MKKINREALITILAASPFLFIILVHIKEVQGQKETIEWKTDEMVDSRSTIVSLIPLATVNPTIQTMFSNETCSSEPNYSLPVTIIVCIILLLIVMVTAGGNFLVILAVFLVKKLQTPSNLLIVSLAFSDFFVALLVLPFGIITVLCKEWPFNEGVCDMYISFDVLLCTSSILNLCAISIDRYLVIARPLQYATKRTPCRMAVMIAIAWIASALICIPPNFGWKTPIGACVCSYSEDIWYQIYATFGAFYLPLFVMLVLYGRIFKLAREMSKADARQKVRRGSSGATGIESEAISEVVMPPTNGPESRHQILPSRASIKAGSRLPNELANLEPAVAFQSHSIDSENARRLLSNGGIAGNKPVYGSSTTFRAEKGPSLVMLLAEQTGPINDMDEELTGERNYGVEKEWSEGHPSPKNAALCSTSEEVCDDIVTGVDTFRGNTMLPFTNLTSSQSPQCLRMVSPQRQTSLLSRGFAGSPGRKHSSNVSKRMRNNSDTKAIKTLGIIMGCFCLCWLPFFIFQVCSHSGIEKY
ncbi:unnamed protein product [Protopolystoma xenopodis]|uniref:G-protein coupled receptors family 1 profile domain-containing protein n=1 Tax=Protopolystoma xenopodis TaxID=117903 RepID=A0A3S5BEK2_9PLAT|nr:unnamed protein product [Protopolystoma xenopodis]